MITTSFVDAIKVQFLKQIFEDDFPEKGMKAWLTDVEWDSKAECYKLFFDFTDFEAENAKYFKETYYANRVTREKGLPEDRHYTALEAGMYNPKYSVYFSPEGLSTRDDAAFARDITNFLQEVV